jgi:hypothetical protein
MKSIRDKNYFTLRFGKTKMYNEKPFKKINMKQTAVEWLANELLHLDHEFDMKLIDKNEYQARRKQVTNQAKEMEKEQIIESVVNTVKIGTEKEGVLIFTNEDEILIRNESEQYYNETFKSE